MDALLEEGLRAPKTRRLENEKYGGESDHQSDGETSVQPMMTKIKTVLKSKLMFIKYLYFLPVWLMSVEQKYISEESSG